MATGPIKPQVMTERDKRLMCPSCGSLEKQLFGKSGRQKRFRCKICDRTFSGLEAKDAGPRVEVPGKGLIRAMRFVLQNGPWHDIDPIEAQARAWMATDKKGFLLKYHELERQEVSDKAVGGLVGPDVNTGKVREVIDRLLGEFRADRKRAEGVGGEFGVEKVGGGAVG